MRPEAQKIRLVPFWHVLLELQILLGVGIPILKEFCSHLNNEIPTENVEKYQRKMKFLLILHQVQSQ